MIDISEYDDEPLPISDESYYYRHVAQFICCQKCGLFKVKCKKCNTFMKLFDVPAFAKDYNTHRDINGKIWIELYSTFHGIGNNLLNHDIFVRRDSGYIDFSLLKDIPYKILESCCPIHDNKKENCENDRCYLDDFNIIDIKYELDHPFAKKYDLCITGPDGGVNYSIQCEQCKQKLSITDK